MCKRQRHRDEDNYQIHPVGIHVAILFLFERYKKLLLRNKAAVSRYPIYFPVFIWDLLVSDWIIYCFYFSRLLLVNLLLLLMRKSINIGWQFVDCQHIQKSTPNNPTDSKFLLLTIPRCVIFKVLLSTPSASRAGVFNLSSAIGSCPSGAPGTRGRSP